MQDSELEAKTLDLEYYMANPDAFDALTDGQKDIIDNGGVLDVKADTQAAAGSAETQETVDKQDAGDAPKPAGAKDTSAPPDAGAESEEDTSILAKDGKTTIPIAALSEARQAATQAKQEADALRQSNQALQERLDAQQQQLIAALQQAKAEDAGTGKTEAQDALLEKFEDLLPSVGEELKPLIQQMIDTGVKNGIEAFQKQVEQRVAPIEQSANDKAWEDHFGAIRSAHPTYKADLQGEPFKAWLDGLPNLVKATYGAVLEKGTAPQVIEVFDAFKDALPAEKPEPAKQPGAVTLSPEAVQAKAQAAIDAAKKPAPATLSSIPTGTMGQADEFADLDGMTSQQLVDKFSSNPKAFDKVLRRLG